MMMEQHAKTLETVLKATTPTKSSSIKEQDKDWMEDQKIRAVELEELGEVTEEILQ